MDSKHTPGPWEIEETGYGIWVGTIRPDGKINDIVVGIDTEGYKEEYVERQYANALLIAAAPEMLELLMGMNVEGGHGLRNHERMRAIISKIYQP